jgi:polysaccharide pyruvyl transferase WcaK-like protein
MKIGIIGWYNHSNYGDDRILYCLKTALVGNDFFIVDGFKDARNKMEELNKCDFVLIGGGGMILKNSRFYIDVIENLKKPVGFIGISIEAYGRNMNNLLQAMKDKAEFILVRDKSSREKLNNHFKVIVGPDLTFLQPFEVAAEVKEDVCALNLRYWQYWKGDYQSYYYYFMEKIVNKMTNASKIYPFTKWDQEKLSSKIKNSFDKILPMPIYFENASGVINDHDLMEKYFNGLPTDFSQDILDKTRYLIGMRLHSIIFAMQAGIPFLSLSYQPKNVNFCVDSGLGDLSVDIYDLKDLDKKIAYLKNNYDKLREQIVADRQKNIDEINYIFKIILKLIK